MFPGSFPFLLANLTVSASEMWLWPYVTCMCILSHAVMPTLCDPLNCSPPGSSVHEIFHARILEWVAISSSREFSLSRDQICISCISCIGRQILYHSTTWEDQRAGKESLGSPVIRTPCFYSRGHQLFIYWPHCSTCEILVSSPGIKTSCLASLHWKHYLLTSEPPGSPHMWLSIYQIILLSSVDELASYESWFVTWT